MSCSTLPCPSYPNAKCVIYTGSNLLCTGIKTNDRLDTILQKIDELFCTGGSGGGTTYINAGLNIDVDGVGTLGNHYTISSTITANSGLTILANIVKLGQTIGALGNPSVLLTNTEIPLGDYTLSLNNKTGVGASASAIDFSTTNSVGYSLSQITLSASDLATTTYSVNNIAGNMESQYIGSVGTLQGSSGYFLSGGGGYFYLSNMKGGTTHSTVQVGDVDSQNWYVNGDTLIGLFGTKNTGFGGQTNPTASIDIAPSIPQKAQLRFRGGVDPLSPNEGDTWFNTSDGHIYSFLSGIKKQLDNDYDFTPNTFIQNQFASAQTSANYWIDGHCRIDGYAQIATAGRIVPDSGNTLSITTSSSNTTGANLRVRKLNFFADNTPTFLATPSVYAEAGSDLTLEASQTIYMRTPTVSFRQDTAIDIGGFHPLTIYGSQGNAGEYNFVDLYNANVAGAANSERSLIVFSNNRTTGGATRMASVGSEVVDFTNTTYKGDLLFNTVSASVNTGIPTEYMRLKYDGRLIVKTLDTDSAPPTTTGTTKMVISDSTGLLSFIDVPVPGTPNIPISILMPALAGNNINNGNFTQIWRWATLTSGRGLVLSSNGTSAANGQILFQATLAGANANVGVLSIAGDFSNNHTGTTSINYGVKSIVSGGATNNTCFIGTATGDGSSNYGINAAATGDAGAINYAIIADANGIGSTNYALYVNRGDVLIDPLPSQATPDRIVSQISGSKILGYITLGTGLSITGGVLNATTAGLQGLQSVLDTDSVLTVDSGINANGNDWEIFNIQDLDIYATGITHFRISNYGSASNGDVLSLVDNATGEVGWATPGGGGGGVTSFSAGTLSPLFTTSVATATSTPALTFTLSNAGANTYFGNATGSPAAPSYIAAAALTKTDDTNVTLTLGGAPATALLTAASLTLGWTGTLSIARGGTALSTLGTANQLLRVNSGATALEYFTPTFLTSAVTTLNTLTAATQTFATGTSGLDFNISSLTSTHTFNIPSASATARGLVTIAAQIFEGVKTHNVGTIINETGADSDTRMETVGNSNAFFLDASTNRLGLFTASPSYPVDITGNVQIQSGSLGIGTGPTAASPLVLGGSGWTSSGLILLPSISATAGSSPSIIGVAGTIIEASSGTHAIIAGVNITAPTITAGLATVTNAATLYISGPTSASVTGGGNYSVLINSGTLRANGDVVIGTGIAYSSGGYDSVVRNQTSGRLETVDTGLVGINSQPGTSYSLLITDKDGMVIMTSSSPNTITVPTNASVAFPIGTQILIKTKGTGQTTISPAGGVTIESADGALKSRVQFSVITLIKEATNTWTAAGDLTT